MEIPSELERFYNLPQPPVSNRILTLYSRSEKLKFHLGTRLLVKKSLKGTHYI